MKKRSPTICPIVFSLDIFGDKWSLVILRDLLIVGKCHFREFLASEEKIASNILSKRLELFIENGLFTKHDDPKNKSAAIYNPTGLQLHTGKRTVCQSSLPHRLIPPHVLGKK
jgi:DNA-binding HxlR family transcriptional regulator